MFDSQLTTGWVHHFILRNSNVSWEKGTKRRCKTQTDRLKGVLLTSDVCLQWGHTEMLKMLQERSVMEERKENLRNTTGGRKVGERKRGGEGGKKERERGGRGNRLT